MTRIHAKRSLPNWVCPHCGKMVDNLAERESVATARARAIANAYGYAFNAVVSPRREQPLVKVRAVIAHALRADGLSLKAIGEVLGHRDHSTILSLLRKYPST